MAKKRKKRNGGGSDWPGPRIKRRKMAKAGRKAAPRKAKRKKK